MMVTYLIPLLVLVGFGFYYLNIYRKGKAAGGGFMAGVQAHHREKWQDLLDPGEQLRAFGMGMLWRPWWQYELGRQIPLLRLVWPVKTYELVLTDRDRLLMAVSGTPGTLGDKTRHDKSQVRLENAVEEKQGWAMKLNPLAPKDYKTYEVTFTLPNGPLKLCGVTGTFVDDFRGVAAPVAAAAAHA